MKELGKLLRRFMMGMTLKEMMLQLNDRLAYIEEQMQGQNVALANLTESCHLMAEGMKVFMDDFYGTEETHQPTSSIRLPMAIPKNLMEKIKDPKFLKEFSEIFKKETKSLVELEEELEKIQDQITKGLMGES